ncbi:hypothetical protein [Parvularcula sp. IMCC14364]|uniref:hypothetical protein n=1 Tax=Parvularcula sp. IMCC14364 TaxID=3067902 RepID=UPI0027417CE4|nr:hypothetical protein [Parvularcula sp. IMCC14364]
MRESFNRSRTLYLIQAKDALPERYACLNGRHILLSYGEETSDTDIFMPDSTWTTGRNRL